MTGRRIIAAVLVCAALAGCKVQLNAGLEESDANEIMARLMSNGVVASKIESDTGMYNVMVAKSQFAEAVEIISAVGLPRQRFTNIGQMFDTDGLVASPMQERARYNFAKSQELAKSISTIPGVISVDVHIAAPQPETPFAEVSEPSVSVMVKMNGGDVADELIPQIKHLVSMGVEDVTYERVAVVVTRAQVVEMVPEFTNVAGLTLHNSSVESFKMIIAGTGFAALIFLVLTILAFSRVQRTPKRTAIE